MPFHASQQGAFDMANDATGLRSMILVLGAAATIGVFTTGGGPDLFDRFTMKKSRPSKTLVSSPTTTTTTTETTISPTTDLATTSQFTQEASIASNFDVASELTPSWGSGLIAPSSSPDPVGAFRFICNAGQLLSDDPIAYPGQPGKSHLHQFFGNLGANASSTYSSLRQSGLSTCMSPANRSAYWMPAMLDGKGSVVRPDYVSIYYKRRPSSDPKCSLTSGDIQAEGNCVPLPNGLRFIFGYNMQNPSDSPTGAAYFNCDGATATSGHYSTISAAVSNCPTKQNSDGSYNRLGAVINAPSCWDGKNLDSPDHRSHVAYPRYGEWGYATCPTTHSFVIPTFTMGVWYTVDANLGTWRLSSDDMMPNLAPGSTFHADWFGAWDNNVQSMWIDNCINKRLNCSGGDLGNGKQMKMFNSFSWNASPRLVPVT